MARRSGHISPESPPTSGGRPGPITDRVKESEMSDIRTLPVLPLRDIVVFPHMVVPLFVGRDKSVRALEEVMRTDKQILLATQKNSADDDPAPEDIYDVGVVASVLQMLKLPDGTVKVLVEGSRRAAVIKYTDQADYYEAQVTD